MFGLGGGGPEGHAIFFLCATLAPGEGDDVGDDEEAGVWGGGNEDVGGAEEDRVTPKMGGDPCGEVGDEEEAEEGRGASGSDSERGRGRVEARPEAIRDLRTPTGLGLA